MKKPAFSPQISVCIPVYETERYLAQCLRSVFAQDFDSFEIVVVSDASPGRDEKGRAAKKIVRLAEKEGNKFRKASNLLPVKVIFEEHQENRGILEVRRTLIYESHGEYVFHLDSDDEIVPNALSSLWKNVFSTAPTGSATTNTEVPSQDNKIDIVHGSFVSGWYDKKGNFVPTEQTKCGAITSGKVQGRNIFQKWTSAEISGNVCGKLIRRNLFEKAFEKIPYTECNMADDFLIFFFISQFAESYIGLEEKIYRYRINSGMSSGRKIKTLRQWQLICSAASVFTVISQSMEEFKSISEEEINSIRAQAGFYLRNSLCQMNETVIPELKDSAYEMLCDYWGKNAVERMRKN